MEMEIFCCPEQKQQMCLHGDKLKELKDSKEVIDVVVKGIVNGGVIAM